MMFYAVRIMLCLYLLTTSGGATEAATTLPTGAAAVAAWTAIVDARGPQRVPPMVVAPYYDWYVGDGRWGTVTPETMANLLGGKGSAVWDHPLLGYYQSHDPLTPAAHMAWARGAGIQALVVSSNGQIRPALCEQAQASGILLAPYLEFVRGQDGHGRPIDFLATARQLMETVRRYPKAFWTIGGRPVIFAYKRTLDETTTPVYWAESLLKLQREGLEFTILGDLSPAPPPSKDSPEKAQRRTQWMEIFDGLHSYHVLFQLRGDANAHDIEQRCRDLYGTEVELLRQRKRLACLTVMPGWDNRSKTKPGMVVPRQQGDVYEATWRAACEQKPDLVMVTSFNEWFEGGTIEPSTTTGTRYLELTQAWSARFREKPATDQQLQMAVRGRDLVLQWSGSAIGTVPLHTSVKPNDPAVDLLEIVRMAHGVIMPAHEANDPTPERIHINGGLRASTEAGAAWYRGKAWNGTTGDWYLRFDGTPRVEVVFGTHHAVVFLNGGRMALANGRISTLAYPAVASGEKSEHVLVPLSFLARDLCVPPIERSGTAAKIPKAQDTSTPPRARDTERGPP